jgi:hypothetical protein
MTTRTLAQIDLALTAVERAPPQVNAGAQTTLRQSNLVLESEITTLKGALGVDADPHTGAPATGTRNDIAALTALVTDLRARVAALEAV